MDFQFFLDTLRRRKWLLLSAMVVAGVTTFVVMSALPERYRANTQIKTSFVDYRGKILERNDKYVQKWQVDNAFSNTITKLTGREMLGRLTEHMLHHDMTSPSPFREPEAEDLAGLSDLGIESVRSVLISRQDSLPTSGTIAAANGTRLSQVAEAYGYDFENLLKLIDVKRIGDTDYLDISFSSESPELSYYLVKEYVRIYLDDFRQNLTSEEFDELTFYQNRVAEVKTRIDTLQAEIDRYKKGKAVVDLDEQQRSVVGQLRDIEESIEERRREIRGYENALKAVRADRVAAVRRKADRNSKIAIANSRLEKVKRDLIELANLLDEAPNPARVRKDITAKKRERDTYTEQVATLKRLNDDKAEDRLIDLQQQELDAEIELESAEKAVQSMQREASRLRGRKSGLVNDEAYLATLTSELSILREEYNELIQKRDDSDVIYKKSEEGLEIVEPPQVPEKHESRHRAIVSAFSALTTGTIFALGLFLVTLLDNRLRNPDQLRTLYGKEAIATLTDIPTGKYSLLRLFGTESLSKSASRWIEGVRSLRYYLDQSGKRVIQVTSLNDEAGKSTVVAALAEAFTRANKKTLLLDLNFKHNTLSAYANVPAHAHPFELEYDEGQLPEAEGWYELDGMDIVGNLGGNRSLAEVLATGDFAHKLAFLREEYDYILMESASLGLYADSRELAEYAEGIVCMLTADQSIDASGREAMAWLESNGEKFLGYVLNKVDIKMLK